MENVITEIEVDWSSIREEQERSILEKYSNKGRTIVHFYSKYIFGTAAIMSVIPVVPCMMDLVLPLNETRPKVALFPVSYGLGTDSEDLYWIITFHINLTTMLLIWILVSSDCMYFSLTFHVCGMFAIAGHQLRGISYNEELPVAGSTEIEGQLGSAHEKKRRARCWNRLINIIRLHNRSIWYADTLEHCFTWPFFFVICVNMIIISITGLLAMVRFEVYEESLPAICFAAGQLIHLYFLSLPGQMLIDTSAAIRDSAYDSCWYTLPPKIQRLLILVILRSIYPCQLTAGKFFVCKVETFCSVVQTSLSYLTVLASFK